MNNNIPELNNWLMPQQSSVEEYKKQLAEDRELRHVSKEFEAIMVKTIMKQGMKSAREMGGSVEQDSSSKYQDMAYEQLAEYMGRNAGLGLSDMIYESLKQKM